MTYCCYNQYFLPESAQSEPPETIKETLKDVQKQFKEDLFKLRVDEEDFLSDTFHYYKDPSFDPTIRLRICLRGSPAIDIGGVLRQFYNKLFRKLINNDGGLLLFKGEPYRKIPVFSSTNVMAGIFEVIGKMIAHSILQNGPVFPFLSPIIYWYIASGSIDSALLMAPSMDVGDQRVEVVVRKV